MGLARGSFGSTSGASSIFSVDFVFFFASGFSFFHGRRLMDRLGAIVMGVERGRKARASYVSSVPGWWAIITTGRRNGG